ncbi:class I SAM-dependent methyltransferase [Microvirga sp. VF16]|uniref:class I SAM-dependent methyltransferase n=1 Tax=Microvirga sp. VF16 TaxID=2807101 RepID=UPI00193CADB9|nr:class I SAM-dependent methyltransferase [Microvirga sp. VF16]QRM27254.1 class I SAM-dependent methyltransferase [Microvirga sp. VF16]
MESSEIKRIRQVYAEYRQQGRWSSLNPGREHIEAERLRQLSATLKKQNHSLFRYKILDIGCGSGDLLNWFHQEGAKAENLFGVDLLPDEVDSARRKYPKLTFTEANAENLELRDNSFDLISTFMVFSSILDEQTSKNVAKTITRLLRPGGVIAWYDLRYPNPNNPSVRAMTKTRIRQLFPNFHLKLHSTTLLPPVAEKLGRHTDLIYPLLGKIPVFRSHYVGLLEQGYSAPLSGRG